MYKYACMLSLSYMHLMNALSTSYVLEQVATMSILRARQFPLFLLLISTLFLASSSVNDHDQECQQSICRGIFRNSLKSRQEEDPRTEYFYCWQSCQTSEDTEECEAACRERLDEQLEKQSQKEQGGEDQDEKPTSNPNPYYFPKSTLLNRFGAEEGGYVVLNSLTRLSPFLRGRIKNYRLALFLTAPGTFVLPYHIDAESAFVVSAGEFFYISYDLHNYCGIMRHNIVLAFARY